MSESSERSCGHSQDWALEGDLKDMVTRPKSIVPITGEPDIDESYIRQQDIVLLKTLLIDRTMTALNGGSPVNIKWAVEDYAKEYPDRTGYGCEDQIALDAISSSDGEDLKVVTPNLDGTVEVRIKSCEGCGKGDVKKHNGVRCRVMDWETGKPVLFMPPFEFKPIEG